MSQDCWECKSHILFIAEYRRKVIHEKRRGVIGRNLPNLREQKGVETSEGHVMSAPIDLCVKIPAKYAIP
ncbi:MAG: transposase [Planctomycetaceae bacterium]|nr:transposase [Planctomycetaceae bacterium]